MNDLMLQAVAAPRVHDVEVLERCAMNDEWRADDDPIDKALAKSQADLSAVVASDAERRKQQRAENVRIGDERAPPLAELLSLEQMIERCVWIARGSGVGVLPQEAGGRALDLRYVDFAAYFAASVRAMGGADGKEKHNVPVARLWVAHKDRVTVEVLTFAPGRPLYAFDPKGASALNLWTPRALNPPPDWAQRVALFLEHVAYLVPVAEEREQFLDWLAHIEQQPGVLPHHGYLMIARTFGIGRNWLASVLTRVWRGHVAASLDLGVLLASQYNARLSCKVLAVVDEIHLGESRSMFTQAAKLRQLITADERSINVKYGLEHDEFNVCRWLAFSNHEDALHLPEKDRRHAVVANPTKPRTADYYCRLYAELDDQAFIASVAQYLATRNIARFNPGVMPVLNEAKRAVIAATTPRLEKELKTVLKAWPSSVAAGVDLLTAIDVGERDSSDIKQFGIVMRRLGIEKYTVTDRGRVRLPNGDRVTVWVLRAAQRVNRLPPETVARLVVRYRTSPRCARRYKELTEPADSRPF